MDVIRLENSSTNVGTMSNNLNSFIYTESGGLDKILKHKSHIIEIGDIYKKKSGMNAAKRHVSNLIDELKRKKSENYNLILNKATFAAKISRGGTRRNRKSRRSTRRQRR